MYNRILKRPMFKRGGSSYEAQGTGITSPYDTPRKRYQLGSWGEWEQKTRDVTKDPRGDFSYAAEGFSNLANPYKESGEAKTIGEMLWEGAQGVRGSRDKARELEQKGELAILESQGGRMLAEEAHKRKLEELQKKSELGIDTYKDLHPEKRYDLYLTKWKADVKNNTQAPGVYTHPGWKIVETNVEAFVEGDIEVRDAKKSAKDNRGKAVHPTFYKENGEVDVSLLSGGIVYFDPMSRTWFTINNPGPSATPNIVASFTDGLVDLLEFKESSSNKEQQSGSELADPEGKSTKKKVVKKGTTYEDMQKETVQVSDIKDFLIDPKTWEGTTAGDQRGYGVNQNITQDTDQATTELDELKGWWNDQAWNKDEG